MFSSLSLRPVKINVLFLIRKKIKKKGGIYKKTFFIKTEKITPEHECNERTENV